MSVRRR